MPKNAVQRLQKLENDIKTVISIYEVAKKPDVKNDEAETVNDVKSHLYPGVKLSDGDNTKWGLTERCTSAFDHFKKLASFSPRLGNRILFSSEKKKNVPKKPSSAPSSSSTATVGESDYLWQPTSESNNSKWTDLPESHSLLMSPSKTLQVATEVLSKNTFQIDKADHSTDNSVHQNKAPQNTDKNSVRKNHRLEASSCFNVKTKETLQRKFTGKQVKTLAPSNYITAFIEKEFSKTSKSSGNETSSEISQTRNSIPKKIPRLLKEKFENYEPKNKEKSLEGSKPAFANYTPLFKIPEKRCEGGQRERCLSADGYDKDKSKWKPEQKKNTKSVTPLDSLNLQQQNQKREGENLSAVELFNIIEKSNEKLEKMEMSKVLALDIAAQLKEKHEEMRRSKENMMEKLQKLEKDNERLSTEVKEAREKKKKLQLKMEGFCNYSKTKLLKQDLKNKEILEENEWLKSNLEELEKKYNENYIEKLALLDKTQKERLTEIKNELQIRETRAEEEIKKLIYEKSKLLEKVEELHCNLLERQSKVETLEGKICVLEDEVEKQKQNLKKKTERLEETHKELEAIRQNSQVLEEQVKTLRTNIENFDQMQKTLMDGIADRESQIKTSKTEIEKLQLENASLRKEMEKERDIILIKDKIIEDQQETIKQLREKSEEAKSLIRRNQSLERLLSREREEKLELQEALEVLKMKKEELKKKIKSLEADLLIAPEEVVRDLQKTQMVLHELENQVHLKQKEWEHHLQLLIKEKEQACSVAEFATKKLMQTTNKFQKQSEAHKKLHQVLAENLAEKERHLRETLSKGSCEPVMTVLPDMKKSIRQLHSRQCRDNIHTTNTEWQLKKSFGVDKTLSEESKYYL